MPGLIKGNEIRPSVDIPYSSRVTAIAGGAIAKYDVVVVVSNQGKLMKVQLADADGVAGRRAGPMWISLGKAAADGDRIEVVPWIVISGTAADPLDTSAAGAVGDPVWMDVTPGKVTVTKPSDADDSATIVGRVLTDNATTGSYILCPQDASLRAPLVRVGAVTLPAGGTPVTESLGAAFANGIAICTYQTEPSADAGDLSAGINGAGLLTVNSRNNPTADVVVSYIAYAATMTN